GNIKILYSLTTKIANLTGTFEKYPSVPIDLSLNSNRGGITFSFDTSFTNHQDKMIVINKAIKDWVCVANMHFEARDSIIAPSPFAIQNDTLSMIQFGPLPIGTLAKTYLWQTTVSTCGVYYWKPD